MEIRPMTPADREAVLVMADALYHTDAVEQPVAPEIMARAFSDAVGENPHLRGLILEEQREIAGFVYLTAFYSCEVAGDVVMLEEFFVKEEHRAAGLGQRFLDWLYAAYPNAVRFRLEINPGNRAAHLYERNGFRYLHYGQMVLDR